MPPGTLPPFDIPPARIEQHFAVLGRIGRTGPAPGDGFLRASWSAEESRAMEYIRQAGQVGGLRAAYDGIGNLYLTTPGEQPGRVQVGSHLDTVPNGGAYDGAAGVVAGLEALLALRPAWPGLRHALQLVAWRGEESATYGALCKGSRAAFGLNDPGILSHEFAGQTLREAIAGQGFDPHWIAARKPALSQAQIDAIQAHLELHIEQARRLEQEGKDIGIVTAIRGAVRFRVLVLGEAAHSGGTPLGVAYRRDANLALAYMLVALDRLAARALAAGDDLVLTAGVINSDADYNAGDRRVYENAMTRVSSFAYFTLDIRSQRGETLARLSAAAQRTLEAVAGKYRVGVQFQPLTSLAPAETLDETLQALVYESCQALGISSMRMSSGALHDLAVVTSQRRSDGTPIPGALLFIPCRDGLSHNPQEYASPEAISKGSRVLAHVLYRLAR
jgi:hydantoinase/carbamoylase family amidase